MKKTFLHVAAIVALLLGAVAVYAQMPAGQGGGQWGHGQPPTVDQRLQRMTQALNLSDEQQQKIKPILENESTQMQSLRADTSMSQEDRMAKMKQIRENTSSQINPILNADQQKQYAEMMSRMVVDAADPARTNPARHRNHSHKTLCDISRLSSTRGESRFLAPNTSAMRDPSHGVHDRDDLYHSRTSIASRGNTKRPAASSMTLIWQV